MKNRLDAVALFLVAALAFSLPWEKSLQVPGLGTGTRLLGAVALAAAAASAILEHRLPRRNPVLFCAAGFVFWCALTGLWSVDPASTVVRVLTMLQLVVMAWVIFDVCRTSGRVRTLLLAYVAGAAAAAAATYVRYFSGRQTYYSRYAAPGFDPNDLGVTIALAIAPALYLSLAAAPAQAWLARVAAGLILPAIPLTGSRTALIATLIGFGFAVATWRTAGNQHRAATLVLGALLLLGFVGLAPKRSRDRVAAMPGEITQGTLVNRTRIWKAGLKVLKRRPIYGIGAGAYPAAVKEYIGVPPRAGHEYVAHNTFLSVAVETGLAGAALYGLLLILLSAYAWALPGQERALWLVTLLAWAVGVSTLTWEHRKPGWFFFALIASTWAVSAARFRRT